MSAKQVIRAENAPAPIGAYSQAIKIGDTVYISGQIPLDPATMELVPGDFKTAARQVFDNLKAVAEAAGGGLQDAVKLTIWLTDLSNFAAVNEVMAQYIESPYPARAAIGVASLPKGAQIEIEAILALSA